MPPVASKLTEDDRFRIATWVDNRLRETACSTGDYAGAVPPRRLNRREYHHTVRDLLGVDLQSPIFFPPMSPAAPALTQTAKHSSYPP